MPSGETEIRSLLRQRPFSVREKEDFVSLEDLGIAFDVKSHLGEGVSGTQSFKTSLQKVIGDYRNYSTMLKIGQQISLKSESASMSEGGLFDYEWSSDDRPWRTPHCSHRDGRTLDFSMSPFDKAADPVDGLLGKIALKNAIEHQNFAFTGKWNERPCEIDQETTTNVCSNKADHWHVHK